MIPSQNGTHYKVSTRVSVFVCVRFVIYNSACGAKEVKMRRKKKTADLKGLTQSHQHLHTKNTPDVNHHKQNVYTSLMSSPCDHSRRSNPSGFR